VVQRRGSSIRDRIARLSFAGIGLFASYAPVQAMDIGAKEEARLAAGDVLLDVARDGASDAAQVAAVVDIGAPPDVVWAAMIDCEGAPKFVPNLISCRVLESDPAGAWDVREHMIDWAWFLPTIRNVFRSDYEQMRRLRFQRVGGDLKESAGEWRLLPLREGKATRVFYAGRMAPNGWIPTALVRDQMREDIPKVLTALRRECLTRGKK
jgi:uncharacterized membrane protein